MEKGALISVSDRTGLIPLAESLHKQGYKLVVTSGTGKALTESKIPFTLVEQYTGSPEILDGRVKTLHPRLHAGLLYRRDDQSHLDQVKKDGLISFDVVVVNLYPFASGMASDKVNDALKMFELIDVGGPSMIRAAAKNHRWITVLTDPADYASAIATLSSGKNDGALRTRLAAKAFRLLSSYDACVASYLEALEPDMQYSPELLPPILALGLDQREELRYGENPHQQAAFYSNLKVQGLPIKNGADWKLLSGKPLSYNNMLDFDAALALMKSLEHLEPTAAILKHLNPCGVASSDTLVQALLLAKRCDPRSHFGGVLVFNKLVTEDAATEVREDFAELVIAPGYSEEALEILKTSSTLRIIEVTRNSKPIFEIRSTRAGILVQEEDRGVSNVGEAELMTSRKPTADEMSDLQLAWVLAAHVKSNAITIVRNDALVASGAGQMSRIDSVEIALSKANLHGHLLTGAVAASDAFFPFPDSVSKLAAAGVTCVIAPRGAKRDKEVIDTAEAAGISLLFTEDRHFRH